MAQGAFPQANTSYVVRKEPDGRAFRDQILAMVRDRRQSSERYTHSFRRKLPRWYDLWRGMHTGSFSPTKNNLHIPLIYSTIWSDVARKIATAYSQWPVVGFSGFGPDDGPTARKHEALVNAQLRDAEVIEKEIVTFLGGDLYGTSVSQLMWTHEEEVRNPTVFRAMPLSPEVVRQREKQRVVTFDGPNYRNVDLLDFYPQPGYRTINGPHGMQWVIVRYYLDLDQCRFMASDAGGKVFDADEVERLASESAVGRFRADEGLLRRFETRQGISPNNQQSERYSRPVELIEMWGKIPSEFASSFGSDNVVITVANENYLFRAMDNPFDHRQKPFVSYSPTPDPHYFHAPGKAEIAHGMQVAGNRYLNHQLDAADLLIHPMFIYDRRNFINTRNLFAGPGRIFGVDGDPASSLVPIQMDMKGLQVGAGMTQSLWEFIQLGTGVQEDTVIGGSGPDRQTAREFLGRREASGTRLMLESVMYDTKYLEPLADNFVSMNSQFLEFPREVLILGESARTDPVTGEPLQDTREKIEGVDLARQYSARALGSTMSISKETQKANDLTMFQVIAGAGDAVLGSFNMVNFLRQMLRNLGYQNVNELIQKNPAAAQMMGQAGVNDAGQVPNDDQGLLQMAGGAAPSGPFSGIPQA